MRLRVDTGYPDDWDRLGDLPLLARRCWFGALEGRLSGAPRFLSLVDGGLRAGLAGVVVTDPDAYRYGNMHALLLDPGSPFATEPVRQALSARPAQPPGALLPNLLLTCPGYATIPVGPGAADPAALTALLGACSAWATEHGLRSVALPYVDSASPLRSAAVGSGFVEVPLCQDAWLDLPPGGFDGYLSRLTAHRRRRILAERRRLRRTGLVPRLVQAIDAELIGQLARLRSLHRERYGLPADIDAERIRLSRLVANLGDLASVVLVEPPGGPPVSFALQARDGDTWHEVCCGTDYADPRGRFGYFEATCYTPVELAPAWRIRRISFGIAAAEGKLRRGAHLVPLSALVLGLAPAAQAAVDAVRAAWSTVDGSGSPAHAGAGTG